VLTLINMDFNSQNSSGQVDILKTLGVLPIYKS